MDLIRRSKIDAEIIVISIWKIKNFNEAIMDLDRCVCVITIMFLLQKLFSHSDVATPIKPFTKEVTKTL